MAISILSPVNSFVQFTEVDVIDSCEFPPQRFCLPVFADNDVFFQFVLVTDTKEEADTLCDLTNGYIQIGIAQSCEDDPVLIFEEKPERFRLDDTHVLYNWMKGLTDFGTVISIAECFHIKIIVQGVYNLFEFCSNCFQRIADVCHTSVIEYGNEDNFAGFFYCSGSVIDGADSTCEPLIISFTNKENIEIPYTTQLQLKYGDVPSVQTWIYNDDGDLQSMGIVAKFDGFPPTKIKIDFGGFASGIIKITS